MIKLKFDEQSKTLYVKETGVNNIEAKTKYLNKALDILKKHKKIRILQNSIESSLTEYDDYDKIADFKKKVITEIDKHNYKVYHAVIYDSPENTAASYLYQGIYQSPNYIHKIFSTVSAAEEWLKKQF